MSSSPSYRSSRVQPHWLLRLILVACFAPAASTAVLETLEGSTGFLYYLVLLPVTACLGLLMFTYQDVTLTRDVLTVRWFPLYRKGRKLTEITSLHVIEEVDPWTQGGWGLRMHSGGFALLNRGGPALKICTSEGRYTLITLPDAAAAAEAIRSSPYWSGER